MGFELELRWEVKHFDCIRETTFEENLASKVT